MDEIQSVNEVVHPGTGLALQRTHPMRHLTGRFTRCLVSLGLLSILLSLSDGCQSHQKMIDQAHTEYWRGDWSQSAATLTKATQRQRLDADVLLLDQAMVEFQLGNLAESQRLFRRVRDRFADTLIGETGINSLSYLSDESHRVYAPEDHERVLLQVMLAFNSLLNDDGDAVAYAHQIGEQCQLLLEHRPVEFVNNAAPSPNNNAAADESKPSTIVVDPVRKELAIAPLLRALVRGQSLLNHDESIRNLNIANEWRPDSPYLQTELARAVNNEQAPAGFGTLYVLALVGKGPRKIEATEPVSSQALLVADQLLSAIGSYSLPPTIAPIKVAKIQRAPLTVDSLEILIDDQPVGRTENIADIGQLAVARQKEMMPTIVARSVVRRIVKKGVVVAGKKASGLDKNKKSDLTSFAYDAAGVIWEATEKADLRCWSLLPGSIQIIRVDLPVGTHRLTAVPAFNQRTMGKGFSGSIEVYDGRSTFAIATIADSRFPGQWVVDRKHQTR